MNLRITDCTLRGDGYSATFSDGTILEVRIVFDRPNNRFVIDDDIAEPYRALLHNLTFNTSIDLDPRFGGSGGSVDSGGGSGGESGDFVTVTTEQSVTGAKTFFGGLDVDSTAAGSAKAIDFQRSTGTVASRRIAALETTWIDSVDSNRRSRVQLLAADAFGLLPDGLVLSAGADGKTTATIGHILPYAASTYDLGSGVLPWRHLYVDTLTLSNPFAGKNLYVDSVNGNNSTGLRGDITKPFLTLAAAKAAAVSGDLITVYPGTYNEKNLLKDGVNWHFESGAIVEWTGAAAGGIFDDSADGANGPVACSITGLGEFLYKTSTTSYHGDAPSGIYNCVKISNASSDVSITCKQIYAEWLDIVNNNAVNAILHKGGTLRFHCERLVGMGPGNPTSAYWWEGGNCFGHADYISGCYGSLYFSPLNVTADAYITADVIEGNEDGAGAKGIIYFCLITCRHRYTQCPGMVGRQGLPRRHHPVERQALPESRQDPGCFHRCTNLSRPVWGTLARRPEDHGQRPHWCSLQSQPWHFSGPG
jgi:hypothetical protein